ncbi:MAG: hypothetical protein HRU18_00730 [Pseudoalteromonas sp.]|uniref:hypothetical protein n=1 Tax=Pseudoalteromonas sp. TaxID=53249 RepID=UPI001E09DA9A|nr:hypothetical protein [Pseudoalteromonas sp.]NRA76704.1 hypothetical protein [Pseudoalteromonas sp.]
MDWLLKFFTGGAVKSIENIASEWIETDMESAEAKVLMVKTLDPNGMMRRDLSQKVSQLYTLYIVVALMLLICEFFGYGDKVAMSIATTKITSLFLPITSLFGVIVSASFGVNYANTKQNK